MSVEFIEASVPGPSGTHSMIIVITCAFWELIRQRTMFFHRGWN